MRLGHTGHIKFADKKAQRSDTQSHFTKRWRATNWSKSLRLHHFKHSLRGVRLFNRGRSRQHSVRQRKEKKQTQNQTLS